MTESTVKLVFICKQLSNKIGGSLPIEQIRKRCSDEADSYPRNANLLSRVRKTGNTRYKAFGVGMQTCVSAKVVCHAHLYVVAKEHTSWDTLSGTHVFVLAEVVATHAGLQLLLFFGLYHETKGALSRP